MLDRNNIGQFGGNAGKREMRNYWAAPKELRVETDPLLGAVMAHIVVQVGENEIESVITKRSADEMNLKVGDSVTVVIKSTEVMIQK